MTKFQGGPADGVGLILRRAPTFLRVVCGGGMDGQWDALDQLADRPEADEVIHVYRLVKKTGSGMIDFRDSKGRRCGTAFMGGEYAYIEQQPKESILRNNAAWQKWCVEQAAKDPQPKE